MSTAEEKILLEKHPTLKSRGIIKQLIDANQILPKCELTICHGGSGTVYQSLSYGIPVLCFPTNPDQCLVSYAVTKQKLGRFIMTHKPSVKLIYENILHCLKDNDIKNNTLAYVDKIKEQNNTKI